MTKLKPETQRKLMQADFSFKAPNSFEMKGERWVHNRPILTMGEDGNMRIAFPSYHTFPSDPDDTEAQAAINELSEALTSVAIDIYIAPGDWVVFDNSRLAHRRGVIGDGPRKLYRNLISANCGAMRCATGTAGPIYSAEAMINSTTLTQEDKPGAK